MLIYQRVVFFRQESLQKGVSCRCCRPTFCDNTLWGVHVGGHQICHWRPLQPGCCWRSLQRPGWAQGKTGGQLALLRGVEIFLLFCIWRCSMGLAEIAHFVKWIWTWVWALYVHKIRNCLDLLDESSEPMFVVAMSQSRLGMTRGGADCVWHNAAAVGPFLPKHFYHNVPGLLEKWAGVFLETGSYSRRAAS